MGNESKNTRRHFTPEEKVAAVQRHLVGRETVSKVCEELKVQPSVFYEWQKNIFERAAASFGNVSKQRGSRERELEDRVAKLEAKLTKKDEVIAEISAEYVQLKKELGEP